MKCPYCNKPPYPYKDEFGKPIWKNILRIDKFAIIICIIIILIAVGYKIDTKICHDIIEHPCDYVEQFNCEMKQQEVINYGINTEVGIQKGQAGLE